MRRILLNVPVIFFLVFSNAYAASGEGAGSGLLGKIFLAFVALVVVAQLMPALVLFGSIIRGIFSKTPQTKKDTNVH